MPSLSYAALGLLLAVSLALGACGPPEPRTATAGGESVESPQPAAPLPAVAGALRPLRLHSAAARDHVVIERGPGTVRIQLLDAGARFVVSGHERGNLRRYEDEERRPMAKARKAGGAIFVVSPQDALLFRIVVNDRGARIGVGPADPEPFVLSRRQADHLLVRRGARPLGRVVLDRGRVKVRGPGGHILLVGRDDRLRACYGVLLLADIPAEHRAVILAEVLRAEEE
jgi:hypothetical protein